ncbi:MAG: hypothetical protein D6719_11905 [Candidatus Dadabacteria bacterium]|nr:MAG: hypothetical protein D6719_11905 [Candidatus Dadabacteria bacterium]
MIKPSKTSALIGAILSLAGCGKDVVGPSDNSPGDLALHSMPEGAKVIVREIRNIRQIPYTVVEATPDTLKGLDPGPYRLIFEADGFAPVDTVAIVDEGKLTLIDATLTPLPEEQE